MAGLEGEALRRADGGWASVHARLDQRFDRDDSQVVAVGRAAAVEQLPDTVQDRVDSDLRPAGR
jgi:hypothetical protein